MIPLIDLHAQYSSIQADIDKAVGKCLNEASFIGGESVSSFEKAFAEYLGVKYCSGCGNGTDALEIILKSLGIGPGDEVIVPALSWISTAESVNNVGAEPVFADINESTYTIDVKNLKKLISKKTRAIIPVHLFGLPADMDEILSFSKEHGLFIIEDCAQAHGAAYKGKKTGSFGIASAFSFFPSKNLGAFGDAGAIVTDNPEVWERARRLSNHGQLKTKHEHAFAGRNSRLDSLQAAILNIKLVHLDKWNSLRFNNARLYMSKLSEVRDICLPVTFTDRSHVFHLFVLRAKRRDSLISLLDKNEIRWSIHYPAPLPYLTAYKYKKHKAGDFPVAELVCKEIISLPMFPELTDYQINMICDLIIQNY